MNEPHKKRQPKGLASAFLLLIAALLLIWLFGWSDTSLQLKQLKLEALKARAKAMEDLTAFLKEHPQPEKAGEIHLFLAESTLNDVLSGVKGLEIPLEQPRETRLKILKTELDFAGNLPAVNMVIQASKPGLPELDLVVRGEVDISLAAEQRDHALGRIRLVALVPKARWHWLQFRLKGYVRELLVLKVRELSEKMPDFTIPLKTEFAVNLPTSQEHLSFAVEDGAISGVLSLPAFAVQRTLALKHALFLDEGVHLFFNLESSN